MTSLAAAVGGLLVVAGVLAGWVRRRYLVTTVDGPSMEPTLYSGDRLLVRRTRRVHVGQIVVVRIRPPTLDAPPPDVDRAPADEEPAAPVVREHPDGLLYIKRAIAVAGDPVPVDRVPCLRETRETTVPPGAVVVLGDNAAKSWDSRDYGFVRAEQFVGVAVRRLPAG
ncbi:S26 family signal peptidase [Actinoallomurus purpureus]|uniref:S26 family signal peptidase n=1 Tax=Actinoallomurus purpureus TaxID=478114 RepID=UPI002093CE4F|nr:S26 family signal peptidase [Actinoallomurus purpureus]MCO6007797.1 S26 family signal peptidase [Actinoallomurus purpureus]